VPTLRGRITNCVTVASRYACVQRAAESWHSYFGQVLAEEAVRYWLLGEVGSRSQSAFSAKAY